MKEKYGEVTCCMCGHCSERGKAGVLHPVTGERVYVCLRPKYNKDGDIVDCQEDLANLASNDDTSGNQ